MLKNRLIFRTLIFILIFLFAFPISRIGAHGLETTVNKLVGEYLIQLEYDTLGNISAGEATSFGFELLDPETEKTVKLNRIFVRITKKNGPIGYVGNQYALDVDGVIASRAKISLPSEGEYDFSLQFFRDDEKLAEHTFTLPVDPPYRGKDETGSTIPYLWAITLVGGLIGGIAYGKTLNSSQE